MFFSILKTFNDDYNFGYWTCLLITIRSRLSVPAQVAQAQNQSSEQHYVPYLLANLLFMQ